ncbi:MAG: alpha/beta fold hydrolase [Planctomycetota bacterium]
MASSLIAPARQVLDKPKSLPLQSVTIESDAGAKIAAWHCPLEGSRGIVILVHGIRSNRLAMVPRAMALRERGFSSLMIDLQAHGESGGTNITVGRLEKHDVAAAVAFAKEQHADESIGLIGVSLGGGAALLAQPLGLDALVVESVFTDLRVAVRNRVRTRLGPLHHVATPLLLAQLPLRMGFRASDVRPIEGVAECDCPILIAGGSEDRYTPETETRQLFEAATEPKQLWIAEGVKHRDLYKMKPTEYGSIVFQFLELELAR